MYKQSSCWWFETTMTFLWCLCIVCINQLGNSFGWWLVAYLTISRYLSQYYYISNGAWLCHSQWTLWLFSTKASSKPMLDYCQLNPWEHISMIFESKYHHFHWRQCIWSRQCIWKRLQNVCSDINVWIFHIFFPSDWHYFSFSGKRKVIHIIACHLKFPPCFGVDIAKTIQYLIISIFCKILTTDTP